MLSIPYSYPIQAYKVIGLKKKVIGKKFCQINAFDFNDPFYMYLKGESKDNVNIYVRLHVKFWQNSWTINRRTSTNTATAAITDIAVCTSVPI